MGIGSALSRFLGGSLVARFVTIELMVGVVGGFSSSAAVPGLRLHPQFPVRAILLVIAIGILVGLEIPLLMRILEGRFRFRDLVSHVLTFDYLGALAASIAFPLWLVPKLGLVRAAILFGMINALVALWSTFLFRDQLPSRSGAARRLRRGAAAAGRRHGRVELDRIRGRQPALRRRSDLSAIRAISAS